MIIDLKNGLAWVVLTLSIIWCVQDNFSWEPLILAIGSLAAVITTFNKGKVTRRKLSGTWKGELKDASRHMEVMVGYDQNGDMLGCSKLHKVPNLPSYFKIFIAYSGEYKIVDDSPKIAFKDVQRVYSVNFTEAQVESIIANVVKDDDGKIVEINRNEMILELKTGVLLKLAKIDSDFNREIILDFTNDHPK